MQPDRQYPSRPLVGVGAVVFDGHGCVLLVKRRNEPLAGQWNLPGGAVEVGESLAEAAAREVLEETGLVVTVGPVVDTFDRILRDDDGRVRYHFVLVDFLCEWIGGGLSAGSDVSAAEFVAIAEVEARGVTEKARDVIHRARLTSGARPDSVTRTIR